MAWARSISPIVLLISSLYSLHEFTSDFGQDYAAARGWWQNNNPNGKTVPLLEESAPELAEDYAALNPEMQTAHPPFATLLTVPISFFSWQTAQVIWLVISWGCVVIAWEISRLPLPVCLATVPLWIFCLSFGTHEPLIYLLLAAGLNLKKRKEIGTGILIGFCTSIKVYPLVFVLGMCIRKEYRAMLSFLLTVGILFVLCESVLGFGVTRDWLSYVPKNTLRYVDDERNMSLVRLVRLLIPNALPMLVGILLGTVLVLPLISRIRKTNSISPLLPVLLLSTPLCWRYYLGLLSLAPLRRVEMFCLAIPPIVLLLGIHFSIDTQRIHPVFAGLLKLSIQLPLLLVLLMVWYRFVVGKENDSATLPENI